MKISEVLTSLINAGADAPANLYLITFSTNGNKEITDALQVRTGNFVMPSVAANTVELPYMNDVYHKPVPSSNIDKIGSFTLRVDKDFKCYDFLKSRVAVTETGDWTSDLEDLLIDEIKVEYVSVEKGDSLTPIKTWQFRNCYILSVGSFSYDHGNSNPLSIPIRFTWGTLNKK